jgi:hypothetical protein
MSEAHVLGIDVVFDVELEEGLTRTGVLEIA